MKIDFKNIKKNLLKNMKNRPYWSFLLIPIMLPNILLTRTITYKIIFEIE